MKTPYFFVLKMGKPLFRKDWGLGYTLAWSILRPLRHSSLDSEFSTDVINCRITATPSREYYQVGNIAVTLKNLAATINYFAYRENLLWLY
ncbi:hypothetical protein FNW02_12275 [Komarekiella sp. 'clone 1']|uniref:Uncharacterized protein n=1 Tax=Komarekiella delphini-convector SJRDD-AB1 TaxID=2593771 RepID=A0AA40SX21_9NOST|nr:hypothetical protein [Komarekiella delphini-convector]MBD6616588.1 hypothetical protein [Komarekiella delphini-convector SJRDD-AB1]